MFDRLFALAMLLLPVLSAPSPLLTISRVTNPVPDRYIITLKDGTSRADHVDSIRDKIASTPCNVTHEYDIINGYAGKFSADVLNELRAHPEIASIEEDGIIHTCGLTTQTDAPWGLSRISSDVPLSGSDSAALNFHYTYDDNAGKGTTVYVMDTGIYTEHSAFGGRASWGATFGGYLDVDDSGHGTHVAGTAVSAQYGVAKSAKVIAVKVLDIDGNGRTSDFIDGAQWVVGDAEAFGRPSVASVSLSGVTSIALDSSARAMSAAGVVVVVAAGNDGQDAANESPARIAEAITVGASDMNDRMASFSNFGPSVNIFAPGVDIVSTSIEDDTATLTLSGTSMAVPHVAGYAAYCFSLDSSITPDDVVDIIKNFALDNVLTGIPPDTTNKLLHGGA